MCNCGYTNDPKKKQETTFRITLCGRNASARSGGGVFGEENPCLLDSLNGLGVTYMRQGRFDEAIKLAEKRPRPIERIRIILLPIWIGSKCGYNHPLNFPSLC